MAEATDVAFASFEQKWLAAYPENAMVAIFQPAERRAQASAFGSLVYELEQTAFHAREAQVAESKLAWWRQELANAALGNARHPITKKLFATGPAQAPTPVPWVAMADAALGMIDLPPAQSLHERLAIYRPFYAGVMAAEYAMFLLNGDSGTDATLWIISHLLGELADPVRFQAQLPLDLLARHGATRADLAAPGGLRVSVLRDYLAALAGHIHDILAVGSPAGLRLRVRARLDLALATGAQRAADPLAFLSANTPAGRWRSLFISWREARTLARHH